MKLRYVGIDVGKESSSFCVVSEKGKVLKEFELPTEEEDFRAVFGKLENCLAVVEACPLAEWVYKIGKSEGHIVDIIDSRDGKKAQSRKKKTDKLDARGLSQLARTGWYTRVHCKSDDARAFRSLLTSRKQLTKTERALKASIRGILLSNGVKLAKGQERDFSSDVREALREVDVSIRKAIRPLLKLYIEANELAAKNYKELKRICRKDETAKLLQSVPGVGPATATAFIATIDDPRRFSSGNKVASYVGLVPEVHKSGSTEYYGRITKQGDALLRWLLVEAAHVLLHRVKTPHPLKQWGLMLAEKKGMGKAKVAVARKLACLLYYVWDRNLPYDLALAQLNAEELSLAA